MRHITSLFGGYGQFGETFGGDVHSTDGIEGTIFRLQLCHQALILLECHNWSTANPSEPVSSRQQ